MTNFHEAGFLMPPGNGDDLYASMVAVVECDNCAALAVDTEMRRALHAQTHGATA